MDLTVAGLVLLAALLHAGWNAMLKLNGDRLAVMAMIALGSGVIAAFLAILVANSSLSPLYDRLIDTPVVVKIGAFEIAKPLLLWINDGLMAIFFFLVGLEIKREILVGELASVRKAAIPIAGAIGGMVVPAIVYVAVNMMREGGEEATKGWAIPMATSSRTPLPSTSERSSSSSRAAARRS